MQGMADPLPKSSIPYIWLIIVGLVMAAVPLLFIAMALLEESLFGTNVLIDVYRAMGIDSLLRSLLVRIYQAFGYI